MEMAIARTITAFLLAIVGGLLTIKLFKHLYNVDTPMPSLKKSTDKSLWLDIYGNTKYIAKYFSIAILLSAAVKALIPPETIASLLGGNTKMSTLVAIGMGVPFYTCGGSAIPFMETLMEMGMQKGPMLAFFIAGPATKLETLYAYKSMLGTRVLVFYLALTFIFSYLAGLIYSIF
jgi:Predicted permeases